MIVCAAVLTVLVLVNIVLTYFVFVAVCDVLNAGWRQWTIAAEHFAQHLKDTP